MFCKKIIIKCFAGLGKLCICSNKDINSTEENYVKANFVSTNKFPPE